MSLPPLQELSLEDERFRVIRSIGEECTTDAELAALLRDKPSFTAYDGFEPSGRMHIAQVILLFKFSHLGREFSNPLT